MSRPTITAPGSPAPSRWEARSRSAIGTRRSRRSPTTASREIRTSPAGGGSWRRRSPSTSEIARACGLPAPLRRGWNAYPTDRLWPSEAHDPRLDLAGTAAGAEWIDAFAARVKPTATRDAPPVLGHLDWSGKHFRFAEDRITAVYDWDSVRVATEAVVVGNAAFAFTANWDLPGSTPPPSPARSAPSSTPTTPPAPAA